MDRQNHGINYQIFQEYGKMSQTGISTVATPTGTGKSYDTADYITDIAENQPCLYMTTQKKNLDEEEKKIRDFLKEKRSSATVLRIPSNSDLWRQIFKRCETDSAFQERLEKGLKRIFDGLEQYEQTQLSQYQTVYLKDRKKNSLYFDPEYLKTASGFLTKIIRNYVHRTYPDLKVRKSALLEEQTEESWICEIFPYLQWKSKDILLMTIQRFENPFDDFFNLPAKNFYSNLTGYTIFGDESCDIKVELKQYLSQSKSVDLLFVFRQVFGFLSNTKSQNYPDFPPEFIQDTLELGKKWNFDQGFGFVSKLENSSFPSLLFNGESEQILDHQNKIRMVWLENEIHCDYYLFSEKQCLEQGLNPSDYPLLTDLILELDRWHNRFYSILRGQTFQIHQQSNEKESLDFSDIAYFLLKQFNFESSYSSESFIRQYSQMIASGILAKKRHLNSSVSERNINVYDSGLTIIQCYQEPESQELQFRCFYQPVTAEKIFAELGRQNRVFLISANADSPGVLHNFSLSYFQKKEVFVPPNKTIRELLGQLRQDQENFAKDIQSSFGYFRTTEILNSASKEDKYVTACLVSIPLGKIQLLSSPKIAKKIWSLLDEEPTDEYTKILYLKQITAGIWLTSYRDPSITSLLTFGMRGLYAHKDLLLQGLATGISDSFHLPHTFYNMRKSERIRKIQSCLEQEDSYSSIPYTTFSNGSSDYQSLHSLRSRQSGCKRLINSYDARATSGYGYNQIIKISESQKKNLIQCGPYPSDQKDYDALYLMPITKIYSEIENMPQAYFMEISELYANHEISKKIMKEQTAEAFLAARSKINPHILYCPSYYQAVADTVYQNLGRITRTSWKNQKIQIFVDEDNLSDYRNIDFPTELKRQNGWLQRRFLVNMQSYVQNQKKQENSSSLPAVPAIISEETRTYSKMILLADEKLQKFIPWKDKDLEIGFNRRNKYSKKEQVAAWNHRDHTFYSELLMIADVDSYKEWKNRCHDKKISPEYRDEFFEYCMIETIPNQIFEFVQSGNHILEVGSQTGEIQRIDNQSITLDILQKSDYYFAKFSEWNWFASSPFVQHGQTRFTLHPGANKLAKGFLAEVVGKQIVKDCGGTIISPTVQQKEMTDIFLSNQSGIDIKNWRDPVDIQGKIRPEWNRGNRHLNKEEWELEDQKMKRAGLSRNLFVNLYSEIPVSPKQLRVSEFCQYYRIPSLLTFSGQYHPQAIAYLQNYVQTNPLA